MTMYATESQQFGLKKEATRGTAETSPAKWYPTRNPVEMTYKTNLLNDEAIRGLATRFAPVSGTKEGEGKIAMYLDPQTCGEVFYSLLGSVSSAQQGGTSAYKHTISPSTSISKPSYTFFVDRGLNVLKYNLGVVKKVSLKGGVDNLVEMDVETIFKTEASGSIGSPSYPTQRYLGFQNIDFKVAGSSNTDIKEWTLNIDNKSRGHRALSQSQDIIDVVTPERLMIDGSFTMFFQNTTERDKFIANTAVAMQIIGTGSLIASTYYYTVDINLYEAHYKSFPYGEDQGLLAAKVQYEGVYSTSSSKDIQVDITNTDTSY